MSVSDQDKMREMKKAGVSVRAIAEIFGCSQSRVYYAINPELEKRQRERVARWKKERRQKLKIERSRRRPANPEPEWQVYDGGNAWVETPAERFAGLSESDRQRIINRIRKTGSAISQRKPRPEATADRRNISVDGVAEELPVQPAAELAMRRYLAGDVSALREYLESIGRAELSVPCF